MKNTLAIILSICMTIPVKAQITSEYMDPRDGNIYPTVILTVNLEDEVTTEMEWFAQNLNYDVENSFCYKYESAYCEVFGKLYPWETATAACPDGWHLPRTEEWMLVINTFGGLLEAGDLLNGEGDSNLNLQMGGFGELGANAQFIGIGASGYYWAQKNAGPSGGGGLPQSDLITVEETTSAVLLNPIGGFHKNSVRCVRDRSGVDN